MKKSMMTLILLIHSWKYKKMGENISSNMHCAINSRLQKMTAKLDIIIISGKHSKKPASCHTEFCQLVFSK